MALANFGWTALKTSDQILVVGGTDGELLQESSWIVDFKAKKATLEANSIDTQIASNKLVYRANSNTVYSIGGYSSGGQNYFKKMDANSKWQEYERSHVALNLRDENEIELANSASIYFN